MRGLLVVTGAVLILTAGCGAGEEPGRPTPPAAAPDEPTLYEATATVLEADEGPMLCLGAVLESLPPQCGDVPIEGWSWDTVEGEESHEGVTWGAFHVVGAYDGETFTVAEAGPPRPAPDPGGEVSFEPPCPEPEGGWVAGDGQDAVGAAERYAASQPEYVRSWVYHFGDPRELESGYEEDLPVVYVATFTADAARHEAAIRERWDGPLCVVERDVPSAREARRIRAEAEASLDDLGLRMLTSWEGPVGQAAEIQVVADPGGEGQAALDARFGPGLVRLVPALRPVQ